MTTVADGTGLPARPADTDDAAGRGQLTINPRVVERIAERAAVDATGLREHGSRWSLTGGGRLPKASATIVGRHTRVAVTAAAAADRTVAEAAAGVRDEVTRTVHDLTGLEVDEVDVHLAALSGEPPSGLEPLPAAVAPRRGGAARRAGILLAFVLVALGGLALYEGIVAFGAVDGPEPARDLLNRLDGAEPQTWLIPAGVLMALIGLWLVLAAVRPRPRRALPVTADTGVYLSRRAVESLAEDTASRHPGVVKAAARARRSKVVVRITTDGEPATPGEVRAALGERLDRLADRPAIRVRARREGGAS